MMEQCSHQSKVCSFLFGFQWMRGAGTKFELEACKFVHATY